MPFDSCDIMSPLRALSMGAAGGEPAIGERGARAGASGPPFARLRMVGALAELRRDSLRVQVACQP
jgi:hypothetical protein